MLLQHMYLNVVEVVLVSNLIQIFVYIHIYVLNSHEWLFIDNGRHIVLHFIVFYGCSCCCWHLQEKSCIFHFVFLIRFYGFFLSHKDNIIFKSDLLSTSKDQFSRCISQCILCTSFSFKNATKAVTTYVRRTAKDEERRPTYSSLLLMKKTALSVSLHFQRVVIHYGFSNFSPFLLAGMPEHIRTQGFVLTMF